MIKEFFLAEETNAMCNDDLVSISDSEFIANFRFNADNIRTVCEDQSEENISDKSYNLAPFNSTESFGEKYMGPTYKRDIAEGMAEFADRGTLIHWNNKTNKPNIIYEREYNRNIDNGVYKDDAVQNEIAELVGARNVERRIAA